MSSAFELYPFQPGQTVVMRKPHPCGGKEWQIVRTGADIASKCVRCGHMVVMGRRAFERAVRTVETEEDEHEQPS